MSRLVIDAFAGPGGWDLAARELGLDVLGIELDDAACASRKAVGLRTLQADVAALNPLDFAPVWGFIASAPCPAFSMAGKGEGRVAIGEYRDAMAQMSMAEALGVGDDDSANAYRHHPARRMRDTFVGRRVGAQPVSSPANATRAAGRSATAIRSALRSGPVSAPAPTMHFGHNLNEVTWLRSGQSVAGKGRAERPTDEPALTVISRFDLCEWVCRTNNSTKGGTREGGLARPISEPARTVDSAAGQWEVDHPTHYDRRQASPDGPNGERVAKRLIPVNELAPVITANAANRDVWVTDRPATTVNGDPRISEPGHHALDVSGSQQANAVRVTLVEAAAVQSFPADYPWQGTKSKCYEQVGNAVPPLMARAVLSSIPAVAALILDEASAA